MSQKNVPEKGKQFFPVGGLGKIVFMSEDPRIYMYSYSETSKLIAEVKKRPAIYSKNHADYTNKDAREQLWTEICWEVFPKWSDLDEFERGRRFKDVQKKWRNVRDSFRKEVKFQAKLKVGDIRKKRPYVYFKHMKFLLPIILEQEASQENLKQANLELVGPEQLDENDDDYDDATDVIKFENEDTQFSNSSKNSRTERDQEEQPVMEMWDNTENWYSNDYNDIIHKDVDEDRFFLLSLIPSFKNLSPKQKLTAKVEFLQVLQKISPDNSDGNNKRTDLFECLDSP